MNKPDIHNNIIGILSFQNGLNGIFRPVFYFKRKNIESSHKVKKY